MEVYRNTASGIPPSSYSSPSSAFSPMLAPNSGFASTSVLPASVSVSKLSSSSTASFIRTTSDAFSGISTSGYTPLARLSSLTEWSQQHICAIFEAETDEDALRAIQNTFADKVNASVNGATLPREGIDALVLGMRNCGGGGGEPVKRDESERSRLQVQWKYGVDVPSDPVTNREGSFGGVYVIKGIKRMISGSQKLVEFERHKTVTVKIDSMSSDPAADSRRITSLVFVASDVRVG